jgi:hypothetical protein
VADAATARGNLGVVIPQGYIDGLQMVWNSATSISVTSGTAYIPSLANVLTSNSTLTLSGLSLTASTWYHVYLYSNAGTPAIECVTTAPVLYNGTAYQKTGDASRRYVGSVRSDPSSSVLAFRHSLSNQIDYLNNASTNTVLTGGNATSPTNVSCSDYVAVTSFYARLHSDNNSQQQIGFANADCNFTLSASASLHITSALPPSFTERLMFFLPLASDQSFQYMYLSAPGSTCSVRVQGYLFQR